LPNPLKNVKIECDHRDLILFPLTQLTMKDVKLTRQGEKALQKAEQFRDDGLYDIAVEAYQEAIALFKEDQNFTRQADTFSALGKMYDRLLSDYQKALETYQQSLRLKQMYGLKNLSDEYLNVAVQQNFLGKLPEARDNLERGRHSAQKEDNQQALGKILNLLGDILVEEGYLDEAEEHLQASLEALRGVGDYYSISHVQASIGLLLACRSKYNEALKACQSALDQAEKIAADGAIGTAQLRFGQIHWMNGNFSEARDHLQEAVEIAQRTNIKILRETALDWLDRCEPEKSSDANSADEA